MSGRGKGGEEQGDQGMGESDRDMGEGDKARIDQIECNHFQMRM